MKKILTLILTLLFFSQSFSQWQEVSEMPIPVKGAKAIVQDTIIYIVGGFSDSVLTGTKKIQAYYPESNRWEVLQDSITIPRWGLSVESYGDSAYIFGGATTTNDSSYSIENWGYHNSSNIKGYNYNFNRSFAATSVVEGFLYIFGGYPDLGLNDTLSYLIRFNMIDGNVIDTFSVNDSFADELPSHQMSAVINNKIYIIGGILNSILRDISYLDLNTYSWYELEKKLAQPRAGGVAIAYPDSGQIIIIGGKNEQDEALNIVEVFDISTYEFKLKEPLKNWRSEHTAVIYQDSILYVFGGKNVNDEIVRPIEKATLPLDNYAATTTLNNTNTYLDKDFELIGNYPNPFNPQTDIILKVSKPQYITIKIFDIQGRKIKTLYNNNLTPGKHKITWDATDDFNRSITSGIYFYTISSGKLTETNRMLLIK